MYFKPQAGQTLIELIVVITVGVLIVSALTFATISTLRNAHFAKNEAQATKLAQQMLEAVRTGRDRDAAITSFKIGVDDVTSWSDPHMWGNIGSTCASPNNCYFTVDTTTSIGALTYKGSGVNIPITISPINGFTPAVILSDSNTTYSVEKIVTAIVKWSDFSGEHQSNLKTYLRKL